MKRMNYEDLEKILIDTPNVWRLNNHINELFGKTLTNISLPNEDETQDMILFECADGTAYMMYHERDCCESVDIDDICGDLDCLIGHPITKAEVVTDSGKNDYDDSYTWTFYHLATIKGYVTIRWYGESNGYYSESVDFVKVR